MNSDQLCEPLQEAVVASLTRSTKYGFTRRGVRPVVFLDRDGTIMRDVGYPGRPEVVEILPGVVDGLREFAERGYHLVVVSNQSGVARGFMRIRDVARVNERLERSLREHGIVLDAVLFCPHVAEDSCGCRKPKTGLFELWLRGRSVDLRDSWMVGDRLSDVLAGKAMGLRTAYLCEVPQSPGSAVEADLHITDLKQLSTIVFCAQPLVEGYIVHK